MRKLILIKHSRPIVDSSIPWHEWCLSAEGRLACVPLAEVVADYAPSVIYSSSERKAVETADIIAERLHLPACQVPDLRENDRTGLGIVQPAALTKMIADFFVRSSEIVIGNETADAARKRFADAVKGIIAASHDGDVAIVAHGTVISLFVASHNEVEPFALWQQLGLPSAIVLSLEDYGVLSMISEIGCSRHTQ